MNAVNVFAALRTRQEFTSRAVRVHTVAASRESAACAAPTALDSNPLLARAVETRAGSVKLQRRAV